MRVTKKQIHRICVIRPIWLINYWLAKFYWGWFSANRRDDVFVRRRYISGRIDPREVEAFMDLLAKTPVYSGRALNRLPSYVYDESNGVRDQDYNRGREFFCLQKEHLCRIASWLDPLADQIERAAGFKWRVVNMIASKESETNKPLGDREWHYDRFAHGAFKVLIYLTGADRERGTTEVAPDKKESFLVEGPPGTWIFFDNNTLWHRAVVAQKGVRHLVQVTIAPAFRTIVRPAHVPDGQYPNVPWMPTVQTVE